MSPKPVFVLVCNRTPCATFGSITSLILWMQENHPEAELCKNSATVIGWQSPRRKGRKAAYFARKTPLSFIP